MLPYRSAAARTSRWSATMTYRRARCISGSHSFRDLRVRTYAATALAHQSEPDWEDSFLQGSAVDYIQAMYTSWKESPESVHISWQTYFRNIEDSSIPASRAFRAPPGLIRPLDASQVSGLEAGQSTEVVSHLKVQQLVRAYQSRGHYRARTDPLGVRLNAEELRPGSAEAKPNEINELEPAYYGFTPADLDRNFILGPGILPRFATETRKSMTLREIIAACKATYCGSYGVEYLHIPDRAKCDWLRERLEVPQPINMTRSEKQRILESLVAATTFENFLATKFPTEKRFGLDGAEGLAPCVVSLIDRCADTHGIENIIIGSCHRGRLTMLGTVYGKSPTSIFAEFAGRRRTDLVPEMAGDVKYHLGHDGERISAEGRRVSLAVLPNPSHLEAVDPLATGQTYATQKLENDEERKRVMCLALHGDAAFAGQGVVYETLGLSRLSAYDVGGTVRLIVNNQIGFTTDVHCSRSTVYASDLAKFIDAPVIHVNADDVEAVAFVAQLAADWRAKFQTDIVVDLVCYRKYGHNEFDQPSYTQPLMYQKVLSQTPTLDKYITQLLNEGAFTQDEIDKLKKAAFADCEESFALSKEHLSGRESFPPAWESFDRASDSKATESLAVQTAVNESVIKSIGDKISIVPDGFELHGTLQRVLASRKSTFESGSVDWSTGEALAFGSLLLEGNPVRVTGQDVQRGTFSQRHAVLHDQATGKTWTPLSNLSDAQAPLTIENSPLSEFGAMGFEYGVTLADPHSLVMWEAQFGDFANNAQVMIDNFIVSGETKWVNRSGLVLSLPHGYDGQGAEHSSARLERFLMLCDEEGRQWPQNPDTAHRTSNIQVVYPTTSANYFHLLRRQLRRDFRKPLMVFFSKSLLRHASARSPIADFTGSSRFQRVLDDPEHGQSIDKPEAISRVILCSGQVYVALAKHRETLGLRDVAIIRIEELHPFPWNEVRASLDKYPNAKTIVWAQEETYNGGAWSYIRDRLEVVLQKTEQHKNRRVLYAGRKASASPATGFKEHHAAQEQQLLQDAFSVDEGLP